MSGPFPPRVLVCDDLPMLHRTHVPAVLLVATALAVLAAACDDGERIETPEVDTLLPREESEMQIRSPAFEHEGEIPAVYTCDGQDISPLLEISGVPDQAQALALVVDDPDAPGGTWDHWLLYDIASDTTQIEEAARDAGTAGTNSSGHTEYDGPCPPSGRHRYFFHLYALDRPLDLEPGASKRDLFRAMERHVLAEAELMGTYERAR